MKKSKKILLILLLATPWALSVYGIGEFILSGDAASCKKARMEQQEVLKEEVRKSERLEKEAAAGDAEAMYWTYQYYAISVHDYQKANKWLKLSAENNFIWGMEDYGERLCEMGKIAEGQFYLKKSCSAGQKSACEFLHKYCRTKR